MSQKELNATIQKPTRPILKSQRMTEQQNLAVVVRKYRRKDMAKQQERKGTKTHAVSLITLVDPSSYSEQYRTIRTNIQFASSADRKLRR